MRFSGVGEEETGHLLECKERYANQYQNQQMELGWKWRSRKSQTVAVVVSLCRFGGGSNVNGWNNEDEVEARVIRMIGLI